MILKNNNAQGITLTELIIAMVIVGIIMMGIVSADFAIQKFYKDSSTGAVAGFNTIAMINNISTAAFSAEGSFTNPTDKGILIDTTITNGTDDLGANTFCIKTNRTGVPWECYSAILDASVTPVLNLYSCTRNSPVNNATICLNTENKLAPITSISSAQFSLVTTAGIQRCLFTFQLQVPDTSSTTKIYSASITPPKHRL